MGVESTVRTALFELLRVGLWGGEANPSLVQLTTPEWKELLSMTEKQTVIALVFDGIITLPKQNQPPRELLLRWYAIVTKVENTYDLLESRLLELYELFEQNNFQPILLKGHGIAQHYRCPNHRQCGDIDLYTGKDYEETNNLLKQWAKESKYDPTEKHVGFVFKGVYVENHIHASSSFISSKRTKVSLAIEDEWLGKEPSYIRIGNRDIPIPHPTFNALFIFIHAFLHLLESGISVRQLCDWTMLFHAHQKEIDREKLLQMFDDIKLQRAVKGFGYIAVNYLGLPREEMPFDIEKSAVDGEILLDEILLGGNFGHYNLSKRSSTESSLSLKSWKAFRHILSSMRLSRISAGETGRLFHLQIRDKLLKR